MSNSEYFSTEQLAVETEKLVKSGKPIWAMAAHPQCPPDVAAKLLELEKVWNKSRKGAGNGNC